MSLHALPILFINLGGEMIYILDQRLRAQEIPQVKAQKVINDIVGAMFNARFVEELFRPQELHSRSVLKQAFNRIAHASIMRLNETSMDKLYDLIVMAFKYQASACPRPSNLISITLNHLNALSTMVSDSRAAKLVDGVNRQLIKIYGNMNESEFQFVRYTLFGYFQDIHIRVSLFLRDESQNPNGRFVVPTSGPVPFGTEVPGSIRLFNANRELYVIKHFPNGGRYLAASKEVDSMDGRVTFGRGTKLGTNMYAATKTSESALPLAASNDSPTRSSTTIESPSLAKEELDFLAQLIGCNKATPETAEFRLHLFDLSSAEGESAVENNKQMKESELKWTQTKVNEELSRIMSEMDDKHQDKRPSGSDDNLLDLMDSACK